MGLFRIDLLALWLLLLHMATAAAPVPTKDGFCFKYIIQGYDTCALIAQKHGITAADIESFNKDTWAWLGCRQLYQGDFICLSAGKPPMPMALPQATCGPQVPGTVRPSKWSDLAGLNPCPSSKCCAFWGQCGVSELYCQKSGYRAPPAGPTATVKGATEAPKSPSTKTNAAGKPAGTGANSKSSAQSKTTKANTLKVTTTSRPTTTKATTSKKSTTKTTKWTPEPTVSQYPWNPPWQITMYSDLNCKGDYYHLEGYNHKFLDEKGCLALHGGINSKFTETGVTCKWFTENGLTWQSCDVGTLKKPLSWNVKNGFCKAFSKANCDCSDNWSLYYRSQGCYNGAKKDHLPQWEALQCSIDGF